MCSIHPVTRVTYPWADQQVPSLLYTTQGIKYMQATKSYTSSRGVSESVFAFPFTELP